MGLCPNCTDSRPKSLISGLCQYHYWGNKRSATASPTRRRPPLRGGVYESPEDQEQDAWYDHRIILMTGRCWNCGEIIVTSNRKFAKAAISHIFAKETFPSIAMHDLNYLELGAACGCHRKWEKSWVSAESLKVFPLAVERFVVFYPSIALSERRRIPECFLNHL